MPAALAKQSFEPATSERLSGLLVEGKRYPRKLCGPGLYAEGEESRELSRSAMRGSAQFAQAADSVKVDQAGAGAGAGARDFARTLTDGLYVEALPRVSFLEGRR